MKDLVIFRLNDADDHPSINPKMSECIDKLRRDLEENTHIYPVFIFGDIDIFFDSDDYVLDDIKLSDIREFIKSKYQDESKIQNI